MRPLFFCHFPAVAFVAMILAGCGGGSSSSTQTAPTSGLKKRVLVSNVQGGAVSAGVQTTGTGAVMIVDGNKDALSDFTIAVTGPAQMASAGGFTAVNDSTQNLFSIINNATEQSVQAAPTNDRVVSVVVSKDGKTAFAAVPAVGLIYIMNTADGTTSTIPLSSVSRLVLSPNGTKLLAFVNDPQTLTGARNAFFLIDTATHTINGLISPNSCTTTLPILCDQPFSAVFNNSETQAFILNCGSECGGANANVVKLDFTGATPVFSAPVQVSGATVGFLSGSNLFVAGTPAGSTTGTLQTVNTGSMTASAPIAITDGKHLKMQMSSTNRLYIGATACTPVNDAATGLIRGCLTIFNTSSSALVFPEFSTLRRFFDVTGLQPISNRNVIYICEGGELDIYDINTDQLIPTQIDIVGNAVDVVQIDP